MDIRELEYFVTIAEEKNLTRAAEKLYVGQPTLTKYLQRVNQEWGIPLLVRKGKQMALTYAGERYLSYANRFLHLQHDLENEMNDIKKMDIGSLRVGMPPVRCSILLPNILPEFHRLYPNIQIQILEDSSDGLDQALLDGSLDLAFYNINTQKNDLTYRTLYRDDMYVVLKKGHPVMKKALWQSNGRPCIRLEDLKQEIFLLQDRDQRQGAFIRHELKHRHLDSVSIQEHRNIRASIALAAGGYGIAFLSGGLLEALHHFYEFDYAVLADTDWEMQFAAAWRKNSYLPACAQTFIRLAEKWRPS